MKGSDLALAYINVGLGCVNFDWGCHNCKIHPKLDVIIDFKDLLSLLGKISAFKSLFALFIGFCMIGKINFTLGFKMKWLKEMCC